MDLSRACFVQAGPVCTGMPLSIYLRSMVSVRCWTAYDSATRVIRCLEAMKDVREGGLCQRIQLFLSHGHQVVEDQLP